MLSVTKVFIIERLKGVLKQITGITSGANVHKPKFYGESQDSGLRGREK